MALVPRPAVGDRQPERNADGTRRRGPAGHLHGGCARPGAQLTGHVERISPATGSEFSVLPADNATGNFVKIAQRIPVRIRIDPDQAAERAAAARDVGGRQHRYERTAVCTGQHPRRGAAMTPPKAHDMLVTRGIGAVVLAIATVAGACRLRGRPPAGAGLDGRRSNGLADTPVGIPAQQPAGYGRLVEDLRRPGARSDDSAGAAEQQQPAHRAQPGRGIPGARSRSTPAGRPRWTSAPGRRVPGRVTTPAR